MVPIAHRFTQWRSNLPVKKSRLYFTVTKGDCKITIQTLSPSPMWRNSPRLIEMIIHRKP